MPQTSHMKNPHSSLESASAIRQSKSSSRSFPILSSCLCFEKWDSLSSYARARGILPRSRRRSRFSLRSALGIRDGQVMTKEQLAEINSDILFVSTYNDHGKFDVDKFRKEYFGDPSLQTVKAICEHRLEEPTEAYIIQLFAGPRARRAGNCLSRIRRCLRPRS